MMHIKGEARFRQQKLKKVVCFLPSKRPIANNVKKINKERNKNVACITRAVVTSTH